MGLQAGTQAASKAAQSTCDRSVLGRNSTQPHRVSPEMEENQFSQSLQYCKSMAGMFQSVLTGCRVLQPGIEEFLEKTRKLETQLQSTIITFSSFNESLRGLAEKTNIGRTGMNCD